MTIEPLASPADLDAVLAIEDASFTSPWTREMYLAELENVGVSFCYLARDESRQVLGFLSFWRVLDELHINNLAVAPDHRRRGIGLALLRSVLTEAASAILLTSTFISHLHFSDRTCCGDGYGVSIKFRLLRLAPF